MDCFAFLVRLPNLNVFGCKGQSGIAPSNTAIRALEINKQMNRPFRYSSGHQLKKYLMTDSYESLEGLWWRHSDLNWEALTGGRF